VRALKGTPYHLESRAPIALLHETLAPEPEYLSERGSHADPRRSGVPVGHADPIRDYFQVRGLLSTLPRCDTLDPMRDYL
jgi:hypothetical protein